MWMFASINKHDAGLNSLCGELHISTQEEMCIFIV